MEKKGTLLLSKSQVVKVLQMDEAITILEKAFYDLAKNEAIMPQRTPVKTADGVALFMPALLKGLSAFGSKTVTVFPQNPAKYSKPTILDPVTGEPLSIMDGGYVTAIRTGAVSGVATKLLARENSQVHTIFGTGGMALAQAWAVSCVRNIKKVILYSQDSLEKREEFAKKIAEIVKCEIVQGTDAKSSVEQADILTLITSAKDPIINGDWIQPGTHINGIGSHAPAMRELDAATIIKSKVVCDLVDACSKEAGDFLIPVEKKEWDWGQAHGSLGDVIIGKIPARCNDQEITLFKSVGIAIQDISVAHHVYLTSLTQKTDERG